MVDGNELPEGWTDRMKPLPNDGPARVVEVKDKPSAVVEEADADSSNVADNISNMTKGEKYWYEQTIDARKKYDEVAPLAPFVDVIAYLDANPDATKMVMEHMSKSVDQVGQQGGEISDALNVKDGELSTNVNNPQHQTLRDAGPSDDAMAKELKRQHMELLKQQGIPEHEQDRYVQFLMNPGSLTPSELFGMYSHLRKGRGEPINSNKSLNQETQNKNNRPQLKNIENPDFPPMSIVGINGGTNDPDTEKRERAMINSNYMLDPNQL